MVKRPLSHEEMQDLRRLCLWSGMVKWADSYESKRMRFLKGRGLVDSPKEGMGAANRYFITKEGLAEVARSGRFTLYDANHLLASYAEAVKIIKPFVDKFCLRAYPFQEHMNPENVRDMLWSLAYVRGNPDYWTSSSKSYAYSLMGAIARIVGQILDGEPEEGTEENLARLREEVKLSMKKIEESSR